MSNDKNKKRIKDKVEALKDEFGNHIEDSSFETWLESVKEEVGDDIEALTRKARGIFNPNLVTMQLEDIQSIVLRERPSPYYGTVVALKINNADVGRQMLAKFLPNVTGSKEWHKDMKATLSIVMTYEGLEALGVPQSSLESFPESFKAGMAKRANKLRDFDVNAPENWVAPFGDKGDIHIGAGIIADTKEKWQAKFDELKNTLKDHIDEQNPANGDIEILIEHDFGSDDNVKNVFGYRDGISNPEIKGSGIQTPPSLDGEAISAGEFVLGYKGEAGTIPPMPQPEVLGKNGSFMVLRAYHSHVAAFNKFLKDNTDTDEEAELLGAKMWGRWRSGAPLILSPEQDDEKLGDDPNRNNDFGYKDDPYGKKCPFGAHIRRMNPRNSKDFILSDVRVHRIVRRSVGFGEVLPPDVLEDDGKERGLFFIGINAHAMETVEFLQSQWINDGNFMSLGEEKDPMVGLHHGDKDSDADKFTVPADPIRKRYHGIETFNTLQGGEYFFIPSLSALKWISELS
ncbi:MULTISPECIES: Dyp-type peroxidase [Psychrobacter]|jgi:Dyp-type peroxidase family|uniref:Dyp-type peroxidase n=1 Tax=Psychrobacter TaxID=497 RepID=UPI000EDA2011|nr:MULTISPECIES: Dyp-type peroxidase [Psychrobacter]HCN17523.1 peroxidase [Psychrobacter sp.]